MYKKGKGKVTQMTKKPSEFHDVVDEIDRLLLSLDGDEENVEPYTMNKYINNTTDTNQFEQRMNDGSSLSEEIMTKIKEQEKVEKAQKAAKEKENNWFTFPFTF